MSELKVGIVTKEWPPAIYGGAGVHVLQLTQALRTIKDIHVDVHCFGGKRDDAFGYDTPSEFASANPAVQAIATDLEIARNLSNVDLVHSHTWYANMAGHFASLQYSIPHIVSAHSLEPLRPWKAEQLGGGYAISSWAEKTAYESAAAIIAVSDGMRADVLAAYPAVDPNKVVTIRNGVDTAKFAPNNDASVPAKYGVTGPYAIFVGRITRQKGMAHLLRAWKDVPAEYGLVLAAGSPDEEGIGKEVADLIAELQKSRSNIWWIKEMLPHAELTAMLSQAQLFLCPSVYEPLGIVNLEAMGCETAVLASRVGGIPEVVADKKTGELVDYNGDGPSFEAAFSESITRLMSQPELLQRYGTAGRVRAMKEFGWDTVATATLALYRRVIE
jgi:alpha-maltose-1-phosphate synthase|uniref:glycogen synthase n=1 Tax=Candidatus Planktophila sp. TaxID=2175601 RepID=UPI00404930AE